MENEKIYKKLKEKFDVPLRDNYNRRIVFWYDDEAQAKDIVDTFEFENVKILKLTGTNNFYAKKTLLFDDKESNYLVYKPFEHDDIKDNWLLDIELFSEEFRTDVVSLRMEELNITSNPTTKKVVKAYTKFFENSKRTEKFANTGLVYDSDIQIHLGVLSVLTNSKDASLSSIIRAALLDIISDDNNAISNIEKFGDIREFCKYALHYTGYKFIENIDDEDVKEQIKITRDDLLKFATHIFLSALSLQISDEFFGELLPFVSKSNTNKNNCYLILSDWINSQDLASLFEILKQVEEKCKLKNRFNELDILSLINLEIFPCIDECILTKYINDISNFIVNYDEIKTTIEKRRTMFWYENTKLYYDALLQVANMEKLFSKYKQGFHFASPKELWKKYENEIYLMDLYYRKFHMLFYKLLNSDSSTLIDSFKGVSDYVENLYKSDYLEKLSCKWIELAKEDLEKDGFVNGIIKQKDFYDLKIKDTASSKTSGRIFVIISDALRYEVASELSEKLTSTTKGSSSISTMQGVLPSITKLGMAALLPHEKLSIKDRTIYCDDISSEGTENRNKILMNAYSDSIAIQYKEILNLKDDEIKEKISDKKIIYIYHNVIDSAGEMLSSEDKVFMECETAISELMNLVKIITNKMNGTNIIITADHGFLYSYKPLEEHDKIDRSNIDGEIIESDRRYVIADKKVSSENLLRVPMTEFESDNILLLPKDNIRLKFSGGEKYVHGGATLQEMVVPVITYKNVKSTSKNFEEITKVMIKLISTTRVISNNIFSLDFFQKDVVSGKKVACKYIVYLADIRDNVLSSVNTIIADKTTENPEDRTIKVRFTLKPYDFKSNEKYYLVVKDDEDNIVDRIDFNVNISFIDDFGL